MSTYHLQVVTPDGVLFDGEAQKIVVRTTEGDVCILKNHIDYFAAIDVGGLCVWDAAGEKKLAAISGGFVSVTRTLTKVVAITCEWADDIDRTRAQQAKEKAEDRLENRKSDFDVAMAEYKLRRAINRIRISTK